MRLRNMLTIIVVAWILYLLQRMVQMGKHEVDMKAHNPTLPDGPGSLAINCPRDAPVRIRLHRLTEIKEKRPEGQPDILGIKGHVLELECHDGEDAVKVIVRLEPKGVVKVFAEDGDGVVKLEEWS